MIFICPNCIQNGLIYWRWYFTFLNNNKYTKRVEELAQAKNNSLLHDFPDRNCPDKCGVCKNEIKGE